MSWPHVLRWAGITCAIIAAFWYGHMVIGFGVTAFILFLEGAVQADMQRLEENRKRKEEADREYREFRTKIGPR